MGNRESTILNLEKKFNLNFQDKKLIDTALTHSSYANQKKNVKFNERLEFLGDSVLQLVISEYLFEKFISKDEGELTKIRALIVCENSLHEVGRKWGIGEYINMSKGEELTGGRTRVSILADCVEAVIAAVYLDKGFEYGKKFILDNFSAVIKGAIKNEIILDYKTRLQEVMQRKGDVDIIYTLSKYEGPPHRRKFYMEVSINGTISGSGEGYSKKEAEQNAASNALEKVEEINA